MEGIAAGAVTHRDAKSGRVAAMRWRWRLMNCALAETGRKTGRATAQVRERKTHKQRDTRATHTHGGRGEGRISGHAAARACRPNPNPPWRRRRSYTTRRHGIGAAVVCLGARAPARRIWISPSLFLLSFIRFVFLSFSIASFCLFLFCCCCCCYYYCWFLLLSLIFLKCGYGFGCCQI